MTTALLDAALHELLLRLAAVAPDELVVRSRETLARSGAAAAARMVAAADVPLTRHDARVLDIAGATVAARGVPEPPLRWRFVPGADPADELEPAMAVAAAGAEPGALGVWRAVRVPLSGTGGTGRHAVYVLELGEGEPAPVAERVQTALAVAGVATPLVEVLVTGSEVPLYQRMARAAGVLLWSAEPEQPVRVARTYDRAAAGGRPGFDPGHPVLDGEGKTAVLAYLRAGTVLLDTACTDLDVVDPLRGKVVPMRMRTDGSWIWPDAVAYYLGHYGLAPDPELLSHISAGPPRPAVPDAVAVHRALAALVSA